MSECLALDPAPRPDEVTTKPAPSTGIGAMFKAALESLVAAHSRQFEDTDPLVYRFPPI
jgi:hypothetical protein